METPNKAVIYILIGCIILIHKVSRCNEASQCAGSEISLDCSSSDWLIQVDYEVYGYDHTQDCVVSADTCTGTEFLDPPSVMHCNGKASCTFMVPTNEYLSVCQKNATSLKIVYQCVPKSYSFDLCSDFLEQHKSTIYLTSPKYPAPKMSPMKCSCEIKGQNISVFTLEQTKAFLSPVVYILTNESTTKHITKMSIINRPEFSDISSLEVLLHNKYPEQEFRLWLKITGTDMFIKCGSPVIISVISSTQIATSTHLSYLPSTHLSYLPSSSFKASPLGLLSSYDINVTALPSITLNSNTNPVISEESYLSLPTISTTTISPTASLTTFSTVPTTDSSSIFSSVSTTRTSTQRISQSDEVILIAVIATICGLFLIIFIIATILICRKKNEEVSESGDHIHRPSRNVIDAYEQNDFTVEL
ncbi:uncharacterized protein LOC125677371 [Ostrea edulis]|uniref:uncharacterized protein LOC125677371 n=1 Tax=Ostrea edulis TaxID=37623 RepID=UPI0024AEC371|nr:uncharacterized protein LOC125677371 [Ostrea edulis]